MGTKDWLTLSGIAATLTVASANLVYSLWSSKKSTFINVVTASRIKWIESLRDKVSAFIAINELLITALPEAAERDVAGLLRERDTLRHQIILHLNPSDPVDGRIKQLVNRAQVAADRTRDDLDDLLLQLSDATGEYLHKEWTRVKQEAKYGEHR